MQAQWSTAMDTGEKLAIVIGVACLASLATFGVVYFIWLRSVLKRLVEVQSMLKKVSHLFSSNEFSPFDELSEEVSPKAVNVPKLQMSVEGKAVSILEINGRDVVRFQEKLSEDQKKRIIQYLKVEGFISRHRAT